MTIPVSILIQMRVGDVIALWGRAPISRVIQRATHGGPSHVAVVVREFVRGACPDCHAEVPCMSPSGPMLIECTLDFRQNGIRVIDLADLLAEYPMPGCRAALYPLTTDAKCRMDPVAFQGKVAQLRDQGNHYDAPGLARFLFPKRVQQALELDPELGHEWVCSVCAAMLLRDCGVLPGTADPEIYTPARLIAEPVFQKPVELPL